MWDLFIYFVDFCFLTLTLRKGQEKNKTFKLRHIRERGRVLNCQLTEKQQKQTSRFRRRPLSGRGDDVIGGDAEDKLPFGLGYIRGMSRSNL
ncbi:hypothetical protein OYC64_021061 [Pagothenia borchgrevinki]|uniref:Uncharacterized protein n=1 Tax=Pagothenia borchgrevinki TaxID=8213 RepID=A0ABD2FNW2_PAGBO